MKLLNREKLSSPECLKNYVYPKNNWRDLSRNKIHYKFIVASLSKVQNSCCAYCEQKLDLSKTGKYHIDHFYPRKEFPEKTFDWQNLFLCCSSPQDAFCAKFKDRNDQKNQDDEIVKPDEDDPRYYFKHDFFNGTIRIKDRLPIAAGKKAQQTIDRLNLNHNHLIKLRKSVIAILQTTFISYEEANDQNLLEIIKIARSTYDDKGFGSLIEDFLEEQMKIKHQL